MKTKTNALRKQTPSKSQRTKDQQAHVATSKHPKCPRCGSRTIHLEQLQHELMAALSIHCLICGHRSFIGKPVVRLIRKPDLSVASLQKKTKAPL